MKKIAVGDLGEFWYADYKEPLTPFDGGHGYIGVLLRDDRDRPLCHYCGKTFDNLASHARQRHGLSAREYRTETGLAQQSALVSEPVRIRSIESGMAHRERMAAMGREHQATLREAGSDPWEGHRNTKGREAMYSPEYLNKTGRCYQQVLTVARSLASQGKLTEKQLSRVGIGPGTIRRWFGGGMNELRAEVGAKAWRVSRYDDRELLGILRSLAEELGRTPAESDLRRLGAPTSVTYRHHFGSYMEACRRAGLDPNLPISQSGDFDVRVLSAYAATGRVKRVATLLGCDTNSVAAVFNRYGCPFPPYGASSQRKAWAAEMARRLAGTETQAA